MTNKIKTVLLATLFFAAGQVQAGPIAWDLQFDFFNVDVNADATLTATLIGELQADDNTILVDSVATASLNGVAFVPLTVDSPIITLSGLGTNFCATTLNCAGFGFLLEESGGGIGIVGGHQTLGTFTNATGGTFSLTARDVPAPASLVLMGLGLAGLGWTRRKKA